MATLVAIDNKSHKNLYIDPSKTGSHGADLHLIPVVISEFSNLVVQYPIVFAKNGDTGQFVCSVMLGFKNHENLFWQSGHWQGVYLPLQIQRQPFFVGDLEKTNTDSESSMEQVVCVDFDSPTICKDTLEESQGKALFNNEGEETEFFQQAKSSLAQLLQGEVANQHFIDKINELKLLQPLSVEITFINKEAVRLNGLYTIDREKLVNLSEVEIYSLHQTGYLEAIYTMIMSLGQIYALVDKKNKLLNEN